MIGVRILEKVETPGMETRAMEAPETEAQVMEMEVLETEAQETEDLNRLTPALNLHPMTFPLLGRPAQILQQ